MNKSLEARLDRLEGKRRPDAGESAPIPFGHGAVMLIAADAGWRPDRTSLLDAYARRWPTRLATAAGRGVCLMRVHPPP